MSACDTTQTTDCISETDECFLSGECCEGLTQALTYIVDVDGECAPAECGYVCINCGDGVCGLGEDWCNCAIDCAVE